MRVGVTVADGAPRLPGDPHDEDAYPEANQGIGELEADRDGGGAGNHREADVCVGFSVVPVRDQGGAVEPAARVGADDGRSQLPA